MFFRVNPDIVESIFDYRKWERNFVALEGLLRGDK